MEKKFKRINLPELSKFGEIKGIKPGESVDLLLAKTENPICCFTTQDNLLAALSYKQILIAGGKNEQDIHIERVDNPILTASQFGRQDFISLVINNATDPVLNERMFIDGPNFGQLFMSNIYLPRQNHQSQDLFSIGIEKHGLEKLNQLEKTLGENVFPDNDFRKILKSNAVSKIIAHALGPVGTNISQAMKQYLEKLGVQNKTELIVHNGVEPLEYAEIAASEMADGTLPIHMECAVYYNMKKLFEERNEEVVFADHHFMPLDGMQLASIKSIEELTQSGVIKIATHPSPKPLIDSWIDGKNIQWVKATSNSEAANMVMRGEANICVTTASSLDGKNELKTRHQFGSPMMLFTIGTPLNQSQLKSLLLKVS